MNDVLNGKNIKLVSSTVLAFEKIPKTLQFKQEKPKNKVKATSKRSLDL